MRDEQANGAARDERGARPFDDFRGPPLDLDGRRVALVVVDLQYGSTHPEFGWLAFHRERGQPEVVAEYVRRIDALVLPNVGLLLDAFRRTERAVVYLTVVSEMPDHSDRTPAYQRNARRWASEGLPIPYAVAGTRAAVVRDEIAPRPGEPVIGKVTASGFNSSNLAAHVRNRRLDTLVFAGVATNFCVESTLRDAADLGYDCILVEDACAAVTEEAHRIGVASMRPFAQIATTAALVAALEAASPRPPIPGGL
jgi:biuret amidohydrolase